MKKIIICSPHGSHKQFDFPRVSKSVRIRFGAIKRYKKTDVDFPSRRAIKNTKDKLKMKKILKRAGVNTPSFIANNLLSRLLMRLVGTKQPTFRKGRHHSRGIGMQLCLSIEDMLSAQKGGYFEELMHAEREFRVHVCDGNAFYIDEKLPREEGKDALVKNMDNGYKYREPKTFIPINVQREAVKAVKALKLEFGAVDIGCNGSCVWVYEVNTAMGMRTRVRNLYQEQLEKLIQKKIKKLEKYQEHLSLSLAKI